LIGGDHAFGQKDSTIQDLTFYYNQMFQQKLDSINQNRFQISGYVEVYYAHYSDSLGKNEFQKFPTSAPRSDAFGLNMAMIQGRYSSNDLRGVITLHYGDIPQSAWSPVYNLLQEANLGIRLHKRLWVDAGFFRTHLGFESIQPRENFTTSIATATYFEPYYLSGIKFSWQATEKLTLQANAFNGFNTFIENNKNKTIGLTANYTFSDSFFISFNSLYTNEEADRNPKKMRSYNNIYFGKKSQKLDCGAEFNFGYQEKSNLRNSAKAATMYSALIAAKYKIREGKWAIFSRFEIFQDWNEILTGPVINELHQFVGINALGGTLGSEYKPLSQAYIRIESRFLQTHVDEKIFRTNGVNTNQRWEFIGAIGSWF
jgi:hypothetical protein